jgi:branched-chain amino acid transport system permease protein
MSVSHIQPQTSDVPTLDHTPASTGGRTIWLRFGVVALAVALFPLLTSSPYYLHVAILVLINSTFSMSLSIIARTGQLSLCHAGFASIGGYMSALGAMRLGIPPVFGVLIGGMIAGLVALPLGWIILKLRGVYFVLVTFTFGQMLTLLAIDAQSITEGANGLVGVPPLSIFGYVFIDRLSYFYLAGGFAALVFLFTWRLLSAPAGRNFICVEENLQLAESTGIDARRTQVLAFVLGSAIAGMAGAIMTHYIRYISPDSFTFWTSVAFITMMVVGGRWALAGPFIGALIITPLPELLRATGGLQHIIYGAILILVLQFLPDGVASLGTRLRGLSRKRGTS